MERVLLIVNPAARGGRDAEAEALRACSATGIVPRVVRTTGPGDAARLATSQHDGDPIVVLGGDGTVMEVVGATAGSGIPVGILPGGTGNQLARHLGVPLHVRRAVAMLRHAVTVRWDLGRLSDGRHFALAAGLGLDAEMMAGATPAAKRRLGVGAYILSAARALLRSRSFPVRVEVDGVVYERSAGLAMIANVGSLMDGRFALGPGVRHDDGLLDACVLSPDGLGDAVGLALRMASGRFRDDARMLFLRGRSIRITGAADIPAEADGELLSTSVLDATIVPAGATFLAAPH